MDSTPNTRRLAAAITKSASKQAYYTIRLLADRERAGDAYRAYGYLRWVDDMIDTQADSQTNALAFVRRQQSLLELCYRRETPVLKCPQEHILFDLVRHDDEKNSGLQTYLYNMMAVMAFDAERRGRVISQTELCEYSRRLATAVTEAIYYFIGHDTPPSPSPERYLSVTAAHIVHMLRDTFEDTRVGYFNIPREVLLAEAISPQDITSRPYRKWVCERARLAHRYFEAGRAYLDRVPNIRCRLAGYAYTARFEWMLGVIARDNYCLRSAYPERKTARAGLWMGWSTLSSAVARPVKPRPCPPPRGVP